MKKTIALLLTVLLVLTALPLCASAQEEGFGFAVASDLHYNPPRAELEHDIDDPVFWYANRRAAMEDESDFIIDAFLDQCAENDDVDFVIVTGDLIDNGRANPDQHRYMAAKFRDFEAATGKPIYVINGNHDLSDESATDRPLFKEIYREFGYDEALTVDEKTCSYTADLNEKYRLIALDTNPNTASTEDDMDSARRSWTIRQAKQAKADGKYPILIMHHALLDHMPLQRIFSHNFIIRQHLTTADRFADAGIRLVFSGHEHGSDAAMHISPLGNPIYDLATTSLTMYPLSYRIVNVTDGEIRYDAATVHAIDLEALTAACAGYTDAQLAPMRADLNAYAKDFLKAGIRYRLGLALTAEKIGIKASSPLYGPVDKAVTGLTDLLAMPLYGEEDSAEAVGKRYGITLPATSCTNGWDLVTDLVAAHYEGEEAYTLDSPEVTALLHLAAIAARRIFPATDGRLLTDAADAVLSANGLSGEAAALQTRTETEFGAFNPAEYLLVAVASPLLYGFAYDDDDVNDNHGAIPGYGAATDNLGNLQAKGTTLLDRLTLFLTLFTTYIRKMLGIA